MSSKEGQFQQTKIFLFILCDALVLLYFELPDKCNEINLVIQTKELHILIKSICIEFLESISIKKFLPKILQFDLIIPQIISQL